MPALDCVSPWYSTGRSLVVQKLYTFNLLSRCSVERFASAARFLDREPERFGSDQQQQSTAFDGVAHDEDEIVIVVYRCTTTTAGNHRPLLLLFMQRSG